LTLRAVFRLVLRQTERLIGSILALSGLDPAVPDHSTPSRRAETLKVASPRPGYAPVHLLVDSTGPKLCGSGEWLLETHGMPIRRSWCKLHIGVEADTGRTLTAVLTTNDVNDASQVGTLLDRAGRLASFTTDGAYDQDGVHGEVAGRLPDAALIVPSRSSAVPSETAGTVPTQRDRHLQLISERGRRHWQGIRIPLTCAGRGRHQPVRARDWERAALAHGPPTQHRDRLRCRRPEPNARTRTAGVCALDVTVGADRCSTTAFRSMQHSRTAREVTPVRQTGEHHYAPGPVAQALLADYEALVRRAPEAA